MKINHHYLDCKDSYLFSNISRKVELYQKENPNQNIIRLGIGDVTLPLPHAVVRAIRQATEEMAHKDTFRGYGPEQGYGFLRDAIVAYYRKKGITLESDEIFVSDGAKSDLGNILDILGTDNQVLIPDPVYPVYVDTNKMAGRPIHFSLGNKSNQFLPMPQKDVKADIIYLCSPNNPTGAVYTKEQLTQWVQYAMEQNAVILFDSAYEAFIQEPTLPTTIYEIEDAKKCAIEFCSFSKTAGFTGTRCGYTIVPKELQYESVALRDMWLRRQTTKFNGVPYIIQRGAEAVFTQEGENEVKENIRYYMENAKLISTSLDKMGIWFVGGEHSPYIWLECPRQMKSWEFFDHLLTQGNVVGTPGVGFGTQGEGFFRLTAFGDRDNIEEALRRIEVLLL